MSKELTPLEALDYLNDIAHGRKMKYDAQELKNIIETALKEYAGFQLVFKLSDRNEGKRVHDKLKALKIISKKAKIVDYSNGEYPPFVIFQGFVIETKEEYDLLKEVLLWHGY